MAEKEKDDTDKYLHKLEKKISGKLAKTDKNKKSLKRLLDCLKEERRKAKEEGADELTTSESTTTTETTSVKAIAIDQKEGKQRIQLINSLISKSDESSKKKEAKALRKLEKAKKKAKKRKKGEEEKRGDDDIEEVDIRKPGSSKSPMETEGSSRQEMDAKRLDSSESRIRSFESFARSSSDRGGEKAKKETVRPERGRGISLEPFPEESQGGFLDRVVPGKSKKKPKMEEREREEREERELGTYKDRDMMVEESYEDPAYKDQASFWPGAVDRRPRESEEQMYRQRREEYRVEGWDEERSFSRERGPGGWGDRSRDQGGWRYEGAERRRPRPPPHFPPHPSSSRSHQPSIHINPHHPSNRSYVVPREERWEGRREAGYERRRESYREEGRHSREWVGRGRRAEEEELERGHRGDRYWAYEDDEEDEVVEEDKLSEDDEDFAATGCRRASEDL